MSSSSAAGAAVEFDLMDKDPSTYKLNSIGDTTAAICDSRARGLLVPNVTAPDDVTELEKKVDVAAASKAKKSILKSIINSNPSSRKSDRQDREEKMRNVQYEPSIFAMNIKSTIQPVQSEQVQSDGHSREMLRGHDPANRRVGMVNLGAVGIGDAAPDFELEDTMCMKQRLSSYRGRKILLSFFRFAA